MQDVNLTATEQIPVAEQDVDNLQTVHDNLVKLKPDFNVPIEQFREDMKDDSKLAKIHSYIASKVPTFKVPFSEFKADMFGAPVAPATTPAPAAPTPAAAPNPLTPLAPEKQALPVNKVSAAESLHSRIPYVHIDEEGDTHQVIPSIPATDANPFKMPEAVDAVAPEAPRFPLQGEKSLIPIAPTPDQLAKPQWPIQTPEQLANPAPAVGEKPKTFLDRVEYQARNLGSSLAGHGAIFASNITLPPLDPFGNVIPEQVGNVSNYKTLAEVEKGYSADVKANEKAMEDYHANAAEKVAGFVVSMLPDLPIFAALSAPGAAAGRLLGTGVESLAKKEIVGALAKTVDGLAASGLPQSAVKAIVTKATPRIISQIIEQSAGGASSLGFHAGLQDIAKQVADGKDIADVDYLETVKATAKGGALGLATGMTGAAASLASRAIVPKIESRAGRVATDLASKFLGLQTEVGVFTAGANLMDPNAKPVTFEDWLRTNAEFIGLKTVGAFGHAITGPSGETRPFIENMAQGIKDIGKDPLEKQSAWRYDAFNNLKNTDITPDELRLSGYGSVGELADAVSKGKAASLMSDPNVPATLKYKMAYAFNPKAGSAGSAPFNILASTAKIDVEHTDQGSKLSTYDAAGNLLEVETSKDKDAMERKFQAAQDNLLRYQATQTVMRTPAARMDKILKSAGLKDGEGLFSAEVTSKNPQDRTPEEQAEVSRGLAVIQKVNQEYVDFDNKRAQAGSVVKKNFDLLKQQDDNLYTAKIPNPADPLAPPEEVVVKSQTPGGQAILSDGRIMHVSGLTDLTPHPFGELFKDQMATFDQENHPDLKQPAPESATQFNWNGRSMRVEDILDKGKLLVQELNADGKPVGRPEEMSSEDYHKIVEQQINAPEETPELRTYKVAGKELTFGPMGNGFFVNTDAKTAEEAEAIRADLDKQIGKKNYVRVDSEKGAEGMPDNYFVSVQARPPKEVIPPVVPTYEFDGKPITPDEAKEIAQSAVNSGNQKKLDKLKITGDDKTQKDIDAIVGKKWPKPVATFTLEVDGKDVKAKREDVLKHIKWADDLNELKQLKITNIDADTEVRDAFEKKLKEFVPDVPTADELLATLFKPEDVTEQLFKPEDVTEQLFKPKENETGNNRGIGRTEPATSEPANGAGKSSGEPTGEGSGGTGTTSGTGEPVGEPTGKRSGGATYNAAASPLLKGGKISHGTDTEGIAGSEPIGGTAKQTRSDGTGSKAETEPVKNGEVNGEVSKEVGQKEEEITAEDQRGAPAKHNQPGEVVKDITDLLFEKKDPTKDLFAKVDFAKELTPEVDPTEALFEKKVDPTEALFEKKAPVDAATLANTYKDRLSKLKKEDPEGYWSVDMPSDEVIKDAAENNRLVDINGGMGIVTADGNLIGLFKYNAKASGTAKAVQAERIKLGGLKLDAYDTAGTGKVDLVKEYKKAGFREVSRVDFNPDMAPKDMPEAVRAKKPDVVTMVYDPTGTMDIKERRFSAADYDQAMSYRDSFTKPEPVPDHNKSADTQGFFADVVSGKSDKFKPRRKWNPLMVFTKAQEAVHAAYEKFNGNFDEHIATSIPGFRDIQIKVVSAVNDMFGKKGGLLYDIGGSEGGFGKTITSLSDGRMRSINLDASSEMEKAHKATPVEGAEFKKEAFGEGFEWDGEKFEKHVPEEKADVVHESMTFQFIDEKRGDKLKEVVDNYLKPDGLFITEEKVHPKLDAQWDANERKKDTEFKPQYYDQDQIDKKREEVLTGMVTNQTTHERYKNELMKKFDHVAEYWDAGNFKGFVASNDKAKVDAFLKSVGNTDTQYSEKNINAAEISPETSSNYANMTEDGQGNFVFYHYSDKERKAITPEKFGTNTSRATSAEEVAAMGRVGGMSQFYTDAADRETKVGSQGHEVKIPSDKVYDFNSDPLKLIDEARKQFKAKYPELPFTPNDQLAWVTKVAHDKGFDMTVAEWDGKTRAQSVVEHVPSYTETRLGPLVVKPFENKYVSNREAGYKSVIPKTQSEMLDEAYSAINAERNKAGKYDDLYHLQNNPGKYSQEEVTQMVNDSNLSEAVKKQYNDALTYRDKGRSSQEPTDVGFQAGKLFTHKGEIPKFKNLTDLTNWLASWSKKNKVFASDAAKADDKIFVKKLAEHTLEELRAWEGLTKYKYLGFYDHDIPNILNPALQKFALKRYGVELTDAEIKLYHMLSSFASPSANPDFDSSVGLAVFDRYMKTGEVSALADKQATHWSKNAKGTLVDTGVPKFDAEGNPVRAKVAKAYADVALNKFNVILKSFDGDLAKAIDWVASRHSFEEISEVMGTPLKGTKALTVHENLTKEEGGFGVFGLFGDAGPKLGSYVLNRTGEYSTITKDLWYARTMARLTGEPLQDKDGNPLTKPWGLTIEGLRKRKLADKAWEIVAEKLGITPAAVQQRMWDFEKRLYEDMGQTESNKFASEGFFKKARELEPTFEHEGTMSPTQIEKAVKDINTEPTEGQKEAGNYRLGHIALKGMDISVENAKGSTRSGVDAEGNAWSSEMKDHYGYIKGTVGKDGDPIDTFIGDKPESHWAFVVDQVNPKTGEFDESKVMLGYSDIAAAKEAYHRNYSDDWEGFKDITAIPISGLKDWLYDGAKQGKPFADYAEHSELYKHSMEEPKLIKDVVEHLDKTSSQAKNTKLFDNDQTADYLKGKIEDEWIEPIRENPWAGLHVNKEVFIHPDTNAEEAVVTWVHENAHVELHKEFPKAVDRTRYLENLYDGLGETEMKRVVPEEYWDDGKSIMAKEYLAHLAEDMVYKNGLLEKAPEDVQKLIFDTVHKFTNLNNLEDAKTIVDNKRRGNLEGTSRTSTGESGRLPEDIGNEAGKENDLGGDLRPTPSGEETEIAFRKRKPGETLFDYFRAEAADKIKWVPGVTEGTEAATRFSEALQTTAAPYTVGKGGKLGAASMRGNLGKMQRDIDRAEEQLHTAKKSFDRMSNDENLDFIDRMESNLPQPTPVLQGYADALRKHLDDSRESVRALGTGKLEVFLENYFPHYWEDPKKAENLLNNVGRRPLEGPKTFLKHRTIEYTREGIDKGLIPVSWNPITLALLKIREMERYTMAHKTINELKDAGYIKFVRLGQDRPADFVSIDDRVGTVMKMNQDTHMLELLGHYFAEPNAARILNNYLSKGLRGNAAFDIYRGLGNGITQLQLGLSAFHLGFTSMDAAISSQAIGWEYLYQGKVGQALLHFAKTPIAPVTNYLQGAKLRKAWFGENTTPELAMIADMMAEAGGRAKQDDFYVGKWGDRMRENIRNRHLIKAGLMVPLRVMEWASMPILGHIVPRQKLGVFLDMARYEMRVHPKATLEERRTAIQNAWNSVDNRMGQLVYDNLFWNHTVKDIAMATVRSVGWNLGTFREVGGAPKEALDILIKGVQGRRAVDTHKIAYMISLVTTTALSSAIYMYLRTGKPPKEPIDYAFPKDGGTDKNGDPTRASLPTYVKDLYHYGKDFPSGAATTLKNKLSPVNGIVAQMLSNKDYYGTRVYNNNDDAIQKTASVFKYLGQQMIPFGIRNVQKSTSDKFIDKALPFIGIVPAPYDLNMTDAERKIYEITREKLPIGGRTQETADKSKIISDIRNAFINSKDDKTLDDAVDAKKISEQDADKIWNEAQLSPIERESGKLNVQELYSVYKIATPEERKQIAPILIDKAYNAADKELDEEDVKKLDEMIKTLEDENPEVK